MFDEIVRGIHVREGELPPNLADMRETGDLLFSDSVTDEFLVRREVLKKVCAAQKKLSPGQRFLVYEAYRPRESEVELWEGFIEQLRDANPDWDENTCAKTAESMGIANPHEFGSGHLSGAAIDVTLCTEDGHEFFMGTKIGEYLPQSRTVCADLGKEFVDRRDTLCKAMASQGLVNDPSRWWHFSYGDRTWAEVTKRASAFFAPIE